VARQARDTGDGDPYSAAEEDALAEAIEEALYGDLGDDEDQPQRPGDSLFAEAQVEWAGTVDENGRGGVRRTVLGRGQQLDLTEVRQAAAELRTARIGGGLRSYRAKGWRSQLRQMRSTRRGREALESAGFNPDTMRRWRTGRQRPSAASQARLSSLYGQVRNPAAASAQHRVAEAFTAAMRRAYGVNVRLRDIRQLRIDD
jgi:hypothetical protein